MADALARRAVAEAPLGPGERLDPNTAPAEQLERLPGIGPAKARAIVQDREEIGSFRTLVDLQRVPGIGPTLLTRIERHIALRALPPAGVEPTSHAGDAAAVDLNAADRTTLRTLPGIGQARAESILAYRARHGRFRRLEELLEVPGIGAAILRGLQGRVTVR